MQIHNKMKKKKNCCFNWKCLEFQIISSRWRWAIWEYIIEDLRVKKSDGTYRSDSNTELHQNLVGSDQKNIHFAADQSTLTVDPDHLRVCPGIDLTFLTASRTLNH